MSKKISLGAALGLIALAVTLTISLTLTVSNEKYNSLLNDLPQRLKTYSQLEEISNIVKANYYGSVDESKIEAAIGNGYINGLNDQYSKFMSADEYAEYYSEIQGKMMGIGIKYSRKGNYIKIDRVYENSPAKASGLSKGDLIVAFDGEAITKDNYDEMTKKLEGDKLSTVNLTYRSGKTEKTVSVAKGYEAQSVMTHSDGVVGYIMISDFYSTTPSQVEAAVEKFVSQDAKGIVLDLRDNSSTNFEAAIEVIDVFVPIAEDTSSIATIVDANGGTVANYSSTADSVNIPIVVLVNENTLGGAELIACDLRDFGKAEIVGTTTSGVGVMQKIFELSDGSALLLSIGKIIPYKSECYNGIGVEPDYEVKKTSGEDDIMKDNVYLYAMSLLTDSNEEG